MTTQLSGPNAAQPVGRADPKPDIASAMAEAPSREPREALPGRVVKPGQIFTDWASI
ncbi:MAG: hypothetical protein AAFU80_00195 [Pseudomonadota bacterium]